jgi:hypothetical protein
MKVILSIHNEGYSEHTWWRLFWAYMMKVILSIHDEGYSEHTWWRLFQKNFVRTKLDIYVCITIPLPISMFVLLSPFRYLCLYYYHPALNMISKIGDGYYTYTWGRLLLVNKLLYNSIIHVHVSYKPCQLRRTDYWTDDTLGYIMSTSIDIGRVIVIQT